MSRKNDLYKMYEEEYNKRIKADKEIKLLKLEITNLKSTLKSALKRNKKMQENVQNKINKAVEKVSKSYICKIESLNKKLDSAIEEINRLKKEIKTSDEKNYLIDKLNNQINKDSTNSSIPTSKESIKNNIKRRTNTYNHRISSGRKNGAQVNHIGKTLTKNQVETLIKEKKVKTKTIEHYIDAKKYKNAIVKYKVGLNVESIIEEHIFIPDENSKETLPKEFYSEVTYNDGLKALVVLLGNYCFLPYNKVKNLISFLTNSTINLSEGSVDNFYNEFSNKCENTILNITTNLLNGTYQHTDEITTKENGKDTYYRGYANKENVLYKYHNHKGDAPIIEDGILTNYFGTLITDHDVGMFKYGTNNQDCIIHYGRYCIEQKQNVHVITWPMKIYNLLIKFERNRQILIKFKAKSFSDIDIGIMENEYDDILEQAKVENKLITSKYWKEKADMLLKRSIKYKKEMLFYIHDFSIDYDNNFMERALRMIKSKTKVSGGFRSNKGGIRFGNIMSIIKTSLLRKVSPFDSIVNIMNGFSLFE